MPTSTFIGSHLIRLSVVDFGVTTPTFEDLRNVFLRLPAEPTFTILSNIAVSLTAEGHRETEEYLRRNLFNHEGQTRIRQFEENHGPVAIFGEMTLMLLIDLCRRFSPDELQTQMTVQQISNEIALAFMVGNYFANFAQEEPATDPQSYAIFAFAEALFNERAQFRYSLPRAKIIYDLMLTQVPAVHRFEISEFLIENFGFTLDDYLQGVMILHSQWIRQRIENWNPNENFIVVEDYFRGRENAERLKAVVLYLSQQFRLTTALPDFSDRTALRKYLYSQFGVKSKPLVTFQNRVYPISLKYIGQLSWSGPYYMIIDRLRELGRSRDPFFHYLGNAQERYCTRLLKYSFRNKFSQVNTTDDHPLGDGIVKLNPRWHLVFEVKAKRANTEMLIGSHTFEESSSIRMLFTEPMEQLSNRVSEYRTTFSSRITPILVTSSSLMVNEITKIALGGLIRDLAISNDPDVDFPLILDIEAFEILCAMAQRGYPIADILRQKFSQDWNDQGLENFLYHHYLPGRGEPENKPLVKAMLSVLYDLGRRLNLNRELPAQDDNSNDWRPVFGF